MKLRFVCVDAGPISIVEAAIDDLTLFDAATPPVAVTPPEPRAAFAFRAPAPNPSAGAVRLVVELPESGEVAIDVLDVGGRLVRELYRGRAGGGPLTVAWDGRDGAGRPSPAGLYFVRARMPARAVQARFVRVR